MSDLSEMKTWLRESDSTEWNGPYLVKVAEALERIEAELAAANAKIEAARALHTSTRGLPKHDDLAKFWCDECGQPSPCNTLDALESAPKPTLKENNVGS